MPILQIEIVGDDTQFEPGLAQRLADAAGKALNSRPQGTWVKLRFLPPEHYAENEGAHEGVRPIFVSLLQAEPPAEDARRLQVAELAQAVATATKRPVENVHILFEPAARGRVAFGGELTD